MAPFTFGPCPRCAAKTRWWFLAQPADQPFAVVCEKCLGVLILNDDGTVAECRDATEEERATVPRPVVISEEKRAELRESLKQSRTDIRAWFDAGCPGLTPELERAFPPGTFERLRRFAESPDE
jgi:hypothetical protein